MGTGYTRADVSNNIADGNVINASDLDLEFDAVQAAFDAATGHTHDGTTAEGAPIEVTGPAQEYVSTNTELRPKANNTYDLGSASNQWKDLYVDGTANLDSVDIDAGTIDGTVIGGASAAAGTFTTATATTGNITTVNATTVDTTNIEVTNLKAKDGTAAGSIADSTGVVTLASSVLTTTDINGGTVDGVTIGGASAGAATFTNVTANGTINLSGATVSNGGSVTTVDINGGTIDGVTIGGASAGAGTFTTATATTGNITTVNATTVDTTNVEVTNIKAKDGTASATIADSTGVMTVASSVLTTTDINGGTIDGTVIGGSSAAAITGTTITGTSFVSSGDMTFGDNDKAIFGAGSDLQIWHNGSHSIIADLGTGDLQIRAEDFKVVNSDFSSTMLRANVGGDVELYYDNAEKLATTATGVDVTGTITSDGLTVDGASTGTLNNVNFLNTNSGATQTANRLGLGITNSAGAAYTYIEANESGVDSFPHLNFYTGSSATKRLEIEDNGDISFYEDTGTTPKFFWDASAESLGIGTTSIPFITSNRTVLALNGSTDSLFALQRGGGNNFYIHNNATQTAFVSTSALPMTFATSSVERLRIDSSGNVGIGTTSPVALLHVNNSGTGSSDHAYAYFTTGDTGSSASDGLTIGYAASNVAVVSNREDTALSLSTGNSNILFNTNGSERARIDASGNVGIGTSSPTGRLHVVSGSDDPFFVGSTNAGFNYATFLHHSSGDLAYWGACGGATMTAGTSSDFGLRANQGAMLFATNGDNERARIDASGNLFVGTTSAISSTNSGIATFIVSGDYAILDIGNTRTTNQNTMRFFNGNGQVGSISTNGSATAYNTSSDYRLKEDVQPMVGATDRLMALKPVNFAWKVDGSRVDGFLAHEAQEVVPEAVTGEKDGEEMQSIDHSKLVPILTAALQEALTEIADLKARVAALEA